MVEYVPCPNCSATKSKLVGFTWWGGILGPKILTHVKCPSCGTAYNGKTGQSNTTGIVIYTLVAMFIAFLLFVALVIWRLTQ